MKSLLWAAVAFLLLVFAVEGAHAVVDVHQPLMPPIPLDPLDFPGQRSPIDLQGQIFQLPDGTRAEWYHLNGWTRLTSRVALGGGISYGGIETGNSIRYGGAPAWAVLTTHLGPPGLFGFSFDIDGTIPFGDETLYPISSDAASVGVRLRMSLGRVFSGRTWVGWRTRRVSPPAGSQRPDQRPGEDWPSGSSLMAAWHAVTRQWDAALSLRYDIAGLPSTFWWQAEGTWFPVEDLGLRMGVALVTGPAEHRPMDWSWLLGIRWRPGPVRLSSTEPASLSGK